MMKNLSYLAATFVCCGLLLAPPAASRADEGQPLAHMVFFTVSDAPDASTKLVAACEKYLSDHEGTLHFSAGQRAPLEREVNDLKFDVALHLVFESKAAHDTYQTHPQHLAFIEKNKHLWTTVRVFDSYLATGADDDKEEDEEEEVEVTLEQCPKAVQKTLKRESQGGRIAEIEKETEDGHTYFEADVILDGKEYEVEVAEDGTLLSKVLEDDDDDDDDEEDSED